MQQIRFIKRLPYAKTPTKGTVHSAGYDLYAAAIAIDYNNKQLIVDTGLSVSFDPSHVLMVFARSGLATKYGIGPVNKVGIIDADYRGPLKVVLSSNKISFAELCEKILVGDRIAQAILLPIPSVTWEPVKELDETTRGEFGFGSTGA